MNTRVLLLVMDVSRQFCRQKSSALIGAGDGLGLTGNCPAHPSSTIAGHPTTLSTSFCTANGTTNITMRVL